MACFFVDEIQRFEKSKSKYNVKGTGIFIKVKIQDKSNGKD